MDKSIGSFRRNMNAGVTRKWYSWDIHIPIITSFIYQYRKCRFQGTVISFPLSICFRMISRRNSMLSLQNVKKIINNFVHKFSSLITNYYVYMYRGMAVASDHLEKWSEIATIYLLPHIVSCKGSMRSTPTILHTWNGTRIEDSRGRLKSWVDFKPLDALFTIYFNFLLHTQKYIWES